MPRKRWLVRVGETHPGAWPLKIPPLPGEITTSWIVRAALAYGETPTGFARLVWGNLPVWNRDCDTHLTQEGLCQLATRLRVSENDAIATSLRSAIARLGGTNVLTSGLLRIGVFHRVRRRHGQQFCPRCLGEDLVPYMRHDWRLGFLLYCINHGCLLRDACPVCDAPVTVHRSPNSQIDRCWKCDATLVASSEVAPECVVQTQDLIWKHWASGTILVSGAIISFPEWLAGVRILFHALGRRGRLKDLAIDQHWIDPASSPESLHTRLLETSRITDRAARLPLAIELADAGPDRHLKVCIDANLRLGDFYDPKRVVPPLWIRALLASFPYESKPRKKRRDRPNRSKLSVENARRRLNLEVAIKRRLNSLDAKSKP